MNIKIFFPVLLVLITLAKTGHSQITQQWAKTYADDATNINKVNGIAVDNAGNLYVTGQSYGTGGSALDYATIKYDPNGNQLWVQRYNGTGNGADIATAIIVDGDGNAYVTGSSAGAGTGLDYATVKYNSSGVQQWVARYNGTGSGEDRAAGIAIDNNGNVFVTGASTGTVTEGLDYVTIKYNSAGAQQWAERYHYTATSGSRDEATAITLDASGNVFVTGYIANGLATVTFKYGNNGGILHSNVYLGPLIAGNNPTALTIDNLGNVYLTGQTKASADPAGFDYVTTKYNNNLNSAAQTGFEWQTIYSGPGGKQDIAYDIAVDVNGNVYVTGLSNTGDGLRNEYATVKYNSTGVQQWVQKYRSSHAIDFSSEATGIRIGADGNIYVTGNSLDGTVTSIATLSYNPGGLQLSENRYNTTGNVNRAAIGGIEIDNTNNIYVAGFTGSSETLNTSYITIKYAQPVPVTFEATVSNQAVNGNEVSFDIFLHSTGAADMYLGHADFVLYFNGENFTAPAFEYVDGSSSFTNSNGISTSSYNDNIVTDPSFLPGGQLVINVNMPTFSSQANFNARIAKVNNTPGVHKLGTFKITGISNPSGTLGLEWKTLPPGAFSNVQTLTNAEPWVSSIATGSYPAPIDITLPVELASFTASIDRRDVYLNWTTASEMNNSGFTVERVEVRPDNSNNWSEIGFVQGNGTTNEAENYMFIDRGLNTGKYDYRLKQIDFNGNFEYFNLSNEVIIGIPEKYDLSQNYPNPFNPATKIGFEIPAEGLTKLLVYDMTGREVAVLINEFMTPGYYEAEFKGTDLSSGIYFYRLSANSLAITKKMMLIK